MSLVTLRFAACVISVPLCSWLMPGIYSANALSSLVAGVMLGIIYLVLRPITKLLLGVFTLLTLGIFSVIIDAWMVLLAAALVPGFSVRGFWWALLASLVVNFLRHNVGKVVRTAA